MTAIALRIVSLLALTLALSVTARAASTPSAIGFVSVVAGKAWRHDQPIQANAAIFEGDTLSTDSNAHLYIRFKDNGFLSLRPSTKVTIERYRVVATDPKLNDIRIVVHEGVARSVTGEGGQAARERFQLRTPLAVVGIRGTDFTVYSSADITRVSVRSGGVVVAPASVCEGVSSGPCANGAAELFAEQSNAILQVSATATATQLIEQVDPQLLPDAQAPALDGESTSQAVRGSDSTLTDAVVDLQENKLLNDASIAPAPQGPIDAAARWGRWQQADSTDAAAVLRELVGGDSIQAFAGDYVLVNEARNRPQLPETGRFNFAMGDYDAQFVTGARRQVATISDASLAIDFTKRRFDVGFVASGAPGRYGFSTSGGVTSKGLMQSDTSDPFLRFNGVLTGANGEQVASVFSGFVSPDTQLQGGATWQVQPSADLPAR